MNAGTDAFSLVNRFEGFSPTAYRDPTGVLTIGYGHTGPDVHDGQTISHEQAYTQLKNDLAIAAAHVTRLCRIPLPQASFDALCSFVFNLGASALSSSHLLQYLNAGDTLRAAEEFPKWCYASGKPLLGLLRRRYAEGSLFVRDPI